MRVVKEVDGGIVRRVVLLDDVGSEVEPVTRFLAHLSDANYSPNTVCAYGYDLRHLAQFLAERSLSWNDFFPPTALEFLGLPTTSAVPTAGAATRAVRRDRTGAPAVSGNGAAGASGDLEFLRVGNRGRAVHRR